LKEEDEVKDFVSAKNKFSKKALAVKEISTVQSEDKIR
jgi:hypothetical protein